MQSDKASPRGRAPRGAGSAGRVAGKVVVVTGAARGQGAAEARALASEGATVVATDIVPPGEVAPGELDGHGEAIVYRRLDVTDPAAWAWLADELRAGYGQVHGLVNNAGMAHLAGLLDVELADWERILRVNTTGPLLGMQALVPLMPRGASIVTIGSVAALTPHFSAAYTASKWAVRGLAKMASVELGPLGIRSNLVHPGYIETPMVAAAPPAFRQAQLEANPLGIVGEPQDVAQLVVYLLSDESRYLSGAEIAVDGGFTAQAGAKTLFDAVRALETAAPRAAADETPVTVVAYRYTDDVAARDRVLPEHRAWLRGLADQGVLLVSGPNGPGEPRGALLLFRADKAQIKSVIANDPFTTSGVIATTEITTWEPVIGPLLPAIQA